MNNILITDQLIQTIQFTLRILTLDKNKENRLAKQTIFHFCVLDHHFF
ncbi:hypothetical protein pb186bvf_010765 [Paramecium bursaria]